MEHIVGTKEGKIKRRTIGMILDLNEVRKWTGKTRKSDWSIIGANLHQRKFQSYGVPREMNVDFFSHYVKYTCPLPRQIAREQEPIASLRNSNR